MDDKRTDSLDGESLERKYELLKEMEEELRAKKASLDALEVFLNEKVKQVDVADGLAPVQSEPDSDDYRKRFDLSWLRCEDVVAEVASHVNVVDGRRFVAVTMPDGKTYVQAKLLDQIVRKLALRNGVDEVASLKDRSSMRRILIATTNFLKRHGVISEEDLPGNYFGRPYKLVWSGGHEVEVFYTPMITEALGDASYFEEQKTQKLLDIEAIKPKEQI